MTTGMTTILTATLMNNDTTANTDNDKDDNNNNNSNSNTNTFFLFFLNQETKAAN